MVLPTASASIQHQDYVRLEFKGVGASGWLSCSDNVCDLRSCPYNSHYIKSLTACKGELFRMVVENGGTVESGERVRFFIKTNKWLGCPAIAHCDKRHCPGTFSQGAKFNNACSGENFRIYARGRTNGETVFQWRSCDDTSTRIWQQVYSAYRDTMKVLIQAWTTVLEKFHHLMTILQHVLTMSFVFIKIKQF